MLFPLIVAGLWLGGCFLISCMGWLWFARKYRVQAKAQLVGKVHLVPTVKFEFIGSYRNSVRVVFTKEGIHFSAPFLFRVFHAPFLLPWKSVRRIRKKAGFRQRGKRLIVEVEDEEGPIRLMLSKEMEEDFLKYYWPQKPKPIARRAFPKDQAQENPQEESAGAIVIASATAGGAENASASANTNPGAGIGAEVNTNASAPGAPGAYPSPFTIAGMDRQPGGGSRGAEAPVQGGTPVHAKATAGAPVPITAAVPAPAGAGFVSVFVPISDPAPVPTLAPAPAPAPVATVSFYVPKTVSVPVPTLATITAAVAATPMMAEPRS